MIARLLAAAFFFVTPTAAADLPAAIAEARVKDPSASFFDVAARRALAQRTADPRVRAALPRLVNCARLLENRPPAGPMAIPRYYLSGSHGPVNPDHAAAERPYTRFEQAAAELAASYAAHGRLADARCLIDLAGAWADADALLDYDPRRDQQSWFTVQWTAASLGLALSAIRGEPRLDQTSLDHVLTWLRRVVVKQISYPGGPTSCCNNHLYWRGLQATAIGIIVPDDGLFRWGLASWWGALKEIGADGALMLEVQRRDRALHYQNFALGPLVLLAELASRQGVDLYGLARDGKTLHDAVRFMAAAIDDPRRVARHASEPQYLRNLTPGHGDLAWMEFYHRRFPEAGLGRFLDKPLFNRRLGGAATFFAARAIDE